MSTRTCGLTSAITATGLLALAGCVTQQPPQDWDGLELRPVKGLDAVYLRPGVEFKAYKTVMIDPVVVAFDKDWDPNSAEKDLSRQLGARDVQRIKDEMAEGFREVFVKELGEGGYTVVEQPVEGTLRVMPGLTDVYINAPDKMSPGRTYTFAMDAGRMTLVMELRDGPSGQLLGADRRPESRHQHRSDADRQQRDQFRRFSPRRRNLGEAVAQRLGSAQRPAGLSASGGNSPRISLEGVRQDEVLGG
jgi:Protein of unknown function (DUF3313)